MTQQWLYWLPACLVICWSNAFFVPYRLGHLLHACGKSLLYVRKMTKKLPIIYQNIIEMLGFLFCPLTWIRRCCMKVAVWRNCLSHWLHLMVLLCADMCFNIWSGLVVDWPQNKHSCTTTCSCDYKVRNEWKKKMARRKEMFPWEKLFPAK